MTAMGRAAATALECLGVRAGERVTVVHNPAQEEIAVALGAAATALGADAQLLGYPPQDRNGEEPPAAVGAAIAQADAVLLATDVSLSHTRARVAATEAGVRVASLPTVTPAVFARAMPVDYAAMAAEGARIAHLLSDADDCRITGPNGTDATLSLRGRRGRNDDGDLRAPGAFGNLPAGEGYIAPCEDAGGGVLVFDGSLAGWGLLEEPLALELRGGAVVSASGGAGAWLLETLDAGGPTGRRVAELGIGTNPAARIGGIVLEDEKVRGTAHVAFGASDGIGGVNRATVHIDGVMLAPTVTVGDVTVLDGGRVLA